MGERTLVRVSDSSIRVTGTYPVQQFPVVSAEGPKPAFSMGKQGDSGKGHSWLPTPPPFPCSFPYWILPQPYHIPSIPLIALWACLWNAEPVLLLSTGLKIPSLRPVPWDSWPLQWEGWGNPHLPLIVFCHSSKKYVFTPYPPLLSTAPHKPRFFSMLSVYNNSVSIKSPPFIPHWSALILSCKPDWTSSSLVFIWKKGLAFKTVQQPQTELGHQNSLAYIFGQ